MAVSQGGGATNRGATVVDLAGAFVVPGLWNVHTHLGGMFPDNLRQGCHESAADRAVRAGRNLLTANARSITGIQVVGDSKGVGIAWRNAIRRG